MAEKGVRIRIVSESVGKGFKEANKSLALLKKTVGALGIAAAAKAIASFSFEAAKAFAVDEKAANRLAMSVKNLGLGFETPRIERYISDLSAMSGITDDQLRPAMQKLLQTTGSVTKSQELLTQALDISRGSGVEYETVVNDLSAAYLGQTKGLSKYSLGLTKAELKTMTFAQVQEKLTKQFNGANAAYLETYAGKFEMISTAAGEAQEKIGGALLTAITDVFGSGDITILIANIEKLSIKISNLIDETAWKWKKFWFATSDRAIIEGFNPFSTYVEDGLKAIDIAHKVALASRNATTQGYLGSMPVGIYETPAEKAARLKAAADAAKREKELAALANKAAKDKAKAEKESLRQKKLSKIFDLEYIQIYAALQGKLSEEDRTRLRLQLAIMDENVDAAENLAKKLGEAQGQTSMLATFLRTMPDAKNPFSKWGEYLAALELEAKRIAALEFNAGDAGSKKTNVDQGGAGGGGGTDQGGAGGGGGGGSVVAPKTYLDYLGMGQFEVRANPYQGDVTVIVNGSVLTNQELTEAIRQGLLNASLSGSSSTTNRINGNFASL